MKELKPWKVLQSEMVFEHPWYKIRRDEVLLPGGHRMDDYFVRVGPEVVLVFPVTADGEVVLVRQYKHGAREVVLELPGGFFDPTEEEPAAAAHREMQEETGYGSEEITFLQALMDNPTKDTHHLHLFLAENARLLTDQNLDVSEEIEVVRVPLGEMKEQVLQGKIKVSGSLALIFLALAYLEQKKGKT
jgi:ADP-ribose pyrophosphatase